MSYWAGYCQVPVASFVLLEEGLNLRFTLGQEASSACPGGRGGKVSLGRRSLRKGCDESTARKHGLCK